MAITQTGTTLRFAPATTNTGTVSSTITVPANAQIVLAGFGTFRGGENAYMTGGAVTFTKGGSGTAMTAVTGGDAGTASWMGSLWYLAAPDTGTNKTLAWAWASASGAEDEVICSVTFWKGIDTASPVRDADGAQSSSFPGTTPTLTAQSGDLIVAWCTGYCASGEGSVDTWTNLATLDNIATNTNADGAWATGSPSGNTTVAAASGTNFVEPAIMAVVLKPAADELSYLRPDSDSALDGWTDQAAGTTNIFQSIDETSFSDADYVISQAVVGATADLKVRLYEGLTQIAEWTHTDIGDTFVDGEQTLSTPEFESITDFSDLFIELDDNQGSVYRFALGDPASGVSEPFTIYYRYKKLIA